MLQTKHMAFDRDPQKSFIIANEGNLSGNCLWWEVEKK